MKNRTIIFSAIAILVVAAVVSFVLMQQSPSEPTSAPLTPSPAPTVAKQEQHSPNRSLPARVTAASPAPKPEDIPAWENQIDQVLRSNVSESQTAQILLNLLPTLPEDGQIEAANHISNLLDDENYAQAKPVLLNPNMPESVLSVLFTDLMNRGDPVKLRSFLDIAKLPNHPFHDEAMSDLEIYLGEDYGTDWTKWNAALEKYLKDSQAEQ